MHPQRPSGKTANPGLAPSQTCVTVAGGRWLQRVRAIVTSAEPSKAARTVTSSSWIASQSFSSIRSSEAFAATRYHESPLTLLLTALPCFGAVFDSSNRPICLRNLGTTSHSTLSGSHYANRIAFSGVARGRRVFQPNAPFLHVRRPFLH